MKIEVSKINSTKKIKVNIIPAEFERYEEIKWTKK